MRTRSRLHRWAPVFISGHGIRCCTFLLPFLIAAQGAQAGGRESKERAAKTACLSGDTARGVALLAQLYVDTNDINYLFNQGRCFEQNGRYAEAIVRFREYLGKNKDAGKTPDADAQRHIADCQALLNKQEPPTTPAARSVPAVKAAAEDQPAPVAPVPPPSPEARSAPPAPLPPTPQPDVAQVVPASNSQGSGLRISGIATAALGLSGIAAGVVLNLKANSLASDLGSSNTSYSRNRESTRSGYETLGWVGYGAGAACVLSGGILYYLGHRQAEAQVALLPTAQPGQWGAVVQGAF